MDNNNKFKVMCTLMCKLKNFVLLKYSDEKCYVYSTENNERFNDGFYVGDTAALMHRDGKNICIEDANGDFIANIIDAFESEHEDVAINDNVIFKMIKDDLAGSLGCEVSPTDDQCASIIDAMWTEYGNEIAKLSIELENK